jgi:hypothetical protein
MQPKQCVHDSKPSGDPPRKENTSDESDQIRPRKSENHELHPSLEVLLIQEPLDRFNVTTDARHMKSVVTFLN